MTLVRAPVLIPAHEMQAPAPRRTTATTRPEVLREWRLLAGVAFLDPSAILPYVERVIIAPNLRFRGCVEALIGANIDTPLGRFVAADGDNAGLTRVLQFGVRAAIKSDVFIPMRMVLARPHAQHFPGWARGANGM